MQKTVIIWALGCLSLLAKAEGGRPAEKLGPFDPNQVTVTTVHEVKSEAKVLETYWVRIKTPKGDLDEPPASAQVVKKRRDQLFGDITKLRKTSSPFYILRFDDDKLSISPISE